MSTATFSLTMVPEIDETGALLAEVNLFLKKSRERAKAISWPPPAAEPVIERREPPQSLQPIEPSEIHPAQEDRLPAVQQDEAKITQRQLRALSRKHLFMMIRDLEKELMQVKEEKSEILLAYQAGCKQ